MAEGTKTVVFARINRRLPSQGVLESDSSFTSDLLHLAYSRETLAEQVLSDGIVRTWVAGDFVVDPHEKFLSGTLGYSEERTDRTFDHETWSWDKGEAENRDTGSDQTIAPFVIALGETDRWVAFATASRLGKMQFRAGLERVLKAAVIQSGLVGYAWEVDLVALQEDILAWIGENPKVVMLERLVKFDNPGTILDEDRKKMREIRARRKIERFVAYPKELLDTDSEEFRSQIEGTESGFVQIKLESRAPHGKVRRKFNSDERAHSAEVYADSRESLLDAVMRELVARIPRLRAALGGLDDQGGSSGNGDGR